MATGDPLWMLTLKAHGEARQSFFDWVSLRVADSRGRAMSSLEREDYTSAQRALGSHDELEMILARFTESDREAVRTGGKK